MTGPSQRHDHEPPLAVSGAGSYFGIPCYLSGMQWARDSWVVSSKVREKERSPPCERQGIAVPALACCTLGHREGASGFQGFCFTSSADGDLFNPMPCEGMGEVGSRECREPGVGGKVGERATPGNDQKGVEDFLILCLKDNRTKLKGKPSFSVCIL